MEKIFSVQDRQDAFEYVLSAAQECDNAGDAAGILQGSQLTR